MKEDKARGNHHGHISFFPVLCQKLSGRTPLLVGLYHSVRLSGQLFSLCNNSTSIKYNYKSCRWYWTVGPWPPNSTAGLLLSILLAQTGHLSSNPVLLKIDYGFCSKERMLPDSTISEINLIWATKIVLLLAEWNIHFQNVTTSTYISFMEKKETWQFSCNETWSYFFPFITCQQMDEVSTCRFTHPVGSFIPR